MTVTIRHCNLAFFSYLISSPVVSSQHGGHRNAEECDINSGQVPGPLLGALPLPALLSRTFVTLSWMVMLEANWGDNNLRKQLAYANISLRDFRHKSRASRPFHFATSYMQSWRTAAVMSNGRRWT